MNPASNMLDLCRFCATKTANMDRLHIFEESGKGRDMLNKISSCLSVVINEDDFLPKVLCINCVNKIESYYFFKISSLKTMSLLEDLVNKKMKPVSILKSSQSTVESSDISTTEIIETTSSPPVIHIVKNEEENPREDLDGGLAESIVCEPSLFVKLEGNNAIRTELTVFRCKQCKAVFPTKKESLEHIELVHNNKHKCTKCQQVFRSNKALKTHRRSCLRKKRERKAKTVVSVVEQNEWEYKEKEVEAKKETYICKYCSKEYTRKDGLILHERRHTGERPFSCTYCEKKFSSTSARNKHIQIHEKRWSHVCSYCGQGFVHKPNFEYHVLKCHTGEFPFPCDKCDKKFVRKQDLQRHDDTIHSTIPKQQYECDICNKHFTNPRYLKIHIKAHELPLEERKKFKCNICEAAFLTKVSLQHHILVHTGEMPYECEICKKRYKNKEGLKIHLLIHSGVKKFVCEVCGKAFALKNSLECHSRTHTGERPFQCNVCHQQFTQKSTLNTHRKRTCHGREPLPPPPIPQQTIQQQYQQIGS